MELVAVSNKQLRREIENRLVEASFDVAPEMSDSERLTFVEGMLATMSQDDAAAFLDI